MYICGCAENSGASGCVGKKRNRDGGLTYAVQQSFSPPHRPQCRPGARSSGEEKRQQGGCAGYPATARTMREWVCGHWSISHGQPPSAELGSRSIKPSNPIGSAMLDEEAGGTVRADVHSHSSTKIHAVPPCGLVCLG